MATERRLYFFPAPALRPRALEAARFAGGLGSGPAVKLFIEGVRRSEADSVSSGLPFPACPTAHDVLEKASGVVDSIAAMYRLYAFTLSSIAQSPAGREFLKYCAGRYVLGTRGALPETGPVELDIREVARFLCDECRGAAERMGRFGIDVTSPGLPSDPRSLGLEMLAQMKAGRVDAECSALLSDMDSFFRRAYRMPIIFQPAQSGPTTAAALAAALERESEPVEMAKAANCVSLRLSSMRRLYLAYRIAVEEFDYGVLSMDPAGAEDSILPLFSRIGVRVEEK